MNEREAFHRAIKTNSKERTVHLVFADWLEENGELFEAALRRSDIKFHSTTDKETIWIENKPFKINGRETNYVKSEIRNVNYSLFEKYSLLNLKYTDVFVTGEEVSGITDISLYYLMWHENDTVSIEGFAENLK